MTQGQAMAALATCIAAEAQGPFQHMLGLGQTFIPKLAVCRSMQRHTMVKCASSRISGLSESCLLSVCAATACYLDSPIGGE